MELAFIILLILVSILGATFIVERGLALRWKKVVPGSIARAIESAHTIEDQRTIMNLCQQFPSPLSRLLLLAQKHVDWPREENVEIVQTKARHEVVQLERNLVFLEIIVGIAPLLGLVGTIFGLILLFGNIGPTGMGESNAVARGISTALYATLFGLIAAIPALVAWSIYSKKIEAITVELERLCEEYIRLAYQNARLAQPVPTQQPAPLSAIVSPAPVSQPTQPRRKGSKTPSSTASNPGHA